MSLKQRIVVIMLKLIGHGPSRLAAFSFCCCSIILFVTHFQTDSYIQALNLGSIEAESPYSVDVKDVVVPTAQTTKRPKLKELIRGKKVIGDPQFLLDFAILGAAKCGTTTLRDWLCDHQEAHCPPREVNDLSVGRPDWLVERLYELPKGAHYKRGYKSPREIAFEESYSQANAMKYLAQYWPETKVFIGLRHPVLWFQSIYNFRLSQRVGESYMPHPNELIKRCHRHVCTKRAFFHIALARLGKTDMTGPEELDMIRNNRDLFEQVPPPTLPNKVFVWITDQLTDNNKTRATQFRRDVQNFVGFKEEVPPVPHVMPNPGRRIDKITQKKIDKKLIDICEPQYDKVRAVLMKGSRSASVWIRKYFLKSEDVFVSSPEHFEEILMSWMLDPCLSAQDESK